jgi:diguanylate cyclase (GGDEF)-like protein/PAS domain S-box-containing protein
MPNARLTIAARLYVVIGVSTFALMIVIAAAVYGTGRMVSAGERLHERVVAGVEEASELAVLLERQVGLASRTPAEVDLKHQQSYRAAFDGLSTEIDTARMRLEQLVPADARDEIRGLTTSFDELRRHAATVFSLSANFELDKATEILNGPFFEAEKRIDAGVQNLLKTMHGEAKADVDALRALRRTLVGAIAGVSLTALILATGFGVFLARSLSGRLQRITTAMTDISGGAETVVEIPSTRDRDEIGEMARALEVFRQNGEEIKRLRLEQQQTLSALENVNEQLLVQNERFDAAVNNMPQALLMFDASERLMICNRRYYEMYGLSPDVIRPGLTTRDLIEARQRNGSFSGDAEEYIEDLRATIAAGKTSERIFELPDGRTIAVISHPMAGGSWVSTHEDITERRRAQAKITYMARHDALTGLPNRIFFNEQMEQLLSGARQAGPLAVLSLDLDLFKQVNDTLGHPVGDLLLREVASRIRSTIRENDLVARLGGDEFAVLQVGMGQPEGATALATRLIEVVAAPYLLDGHMVVVGTSIGIALAPDDGTRPPQLMKSADLALYRAKAIDGGAFCFFEPDMDARMQARRALELDLRKALANGEFELYYQPIVNLKTGSIKGFEALIRWNHPERGMVLPGEFIPLAEEIGLIVPLGEWALRRACSEATHWPSDIMIAVNLSPAQFRNRNLVQAVTSALNESGLSASRLELEITETVLLQNSEMTLATLRQLQDTGLKIAMDDFGTGYSSLSYLRSFPFDKIKIDQSFVRDVSTNKDSLAIVRAVVGLGSSLGMETTAEGVETVDQLEQLRKEGCTAVQGYFFSQARPAAEVRDLLATLVPQAEAIA